MTKNKEYTKIRQFYTWCGIVALALALIWGVATIITAKRVITLVNEENARYGANLDDSLPSILQVMAFITAYTSDPAETDDSPLITAANTKVRPGIVANNCYKFGTKILVNNIVYEVWDRMNPRYGCEYFDIWHADKNEALEFGRQYQKVIIINNHD